MTDFNPKKRKRADVKSLREKFVKMVQTDKDLLFGAFSPTVTNRAKQVVLRAVHDVTDAICDVLCTHWISWPETLEENQQIEYEFYNIAGMAGICGAIDGNLITLKVPKQVESQYVDRKGNHSLNLTVVCTANLWYVH
jgi:hypothetical protein